MAVAAREEILKARSRPATSDRLDEAAAVLRALGDPTRLAMAALLHATDGQLCVCHLEARFALSQPTISHHLRVLRDLGLVSTEKRGTWVHYAIDRARVGSIPGLEALLSGLARDVARPRRACCP